MAYDTYSFAKLRADYARGTSPTLANPEYGNGEWPSISDLITMILVLEGWGATIPAKVTVYADGNEGPPTLFYALAVVIDQMLVEIAGP